MTGKQINTLLYNKTRKTFDLHLNKDSPNLESLSYQYEGNRLISVEDASNNDDGFKNGKSLALEYEYDANSPSRTPVGSNIVDDDNKGITHIRDPAFRDQAFWGPAF